MSLPLRLLHVVPTYLPATRYGGPIYSVHGLCKALAARGHEVHVFTTNVNGPGDSDVPLNRPVDLHGVQVWYFASKHLRRLYWSPPMGRALRREVPRFDLVHLHSVFLWPTWAAARTARASGVPYLLAPRGMLVKELIARKSRLTKTVWIKLIERRNIERAAAIHVTSETEASALGHFDFRLSRVVLVPNGVDVTISSDGDERTDLHDQALAPFILYLGRINWEKGLDRLIPAMAHMPGVRLVIAGNDEENYTPILKRLAVETDVSDRIEFIGPADAAQKNRLFRSASLLVLPSYSENFGIVVLEAMAAGCPVVVTPEVGAADIVTASGGGKVVRGEPEILGKTIDALLRKPAELRVMGEAGRHHVKEHYSWDSVAQRMIEVYEEIARSRPSEAYA